MQLMNYNPPRYPLMYFVKFILVYESDRPKCDHHTCSFTSVAREELVSGCILGLQGNMLEEVCFTFMGHD